MFFFAIVVASHREYNKIGFAISGVSTILYEFSKLQPKHIKG
jgi:hypothetical protein